MTLLSWPITSDLLPTLTSLTWQVSLLFSLNVGVNKDYWTEWSTFTILLLNFSNFINGPIIEFSKITVVAVPLMWCTRSRLLVFSFRNNNWLFHKNQAVHYDFLHRCKRNAWLRESSVCIAGIIKCIDPEYRLHRECIATDALKKAVVCRL